METTESQDQFGNRVEIQHYADGRKGKTTFPTNKYFDFLGKTYAGFVFTRRYGVPESLNVDIKVYYKDNDSEAALQRDYYGRLWLYFYDEYRLSNGDDRYDYLWVLVADEADADELVKDYRLSRLRVPFVAYDGYGWWSAHEWV
ncbi:MAG: hypothetical protein LBN95_11240 [Prevotellaceae bacterium]|jgi:hypothetical protein|nr:hypothetical protein [Prevotellaceae bacterium]